MTNMCYSNNVVLITKPFTEFDLNLSGILSGLLANCTKVLSKMLVEMLLRPQEHISQSKVTKPVSCYNLHKFQGVF